MLYLNDKPFEVKKFHGGELTALVSNLLHHNRILWLWDDINGASELFILQALAKTIKNKGLKSSLKMPKFPYDRNDGLDDFVERLESGQEVYRVDTLSAIADTLNNLGFEKIEIVEPHSAVAPKLLERCIVGEVTPSLVTRCISDLKARGFSEEDILFVFPDAGAEKRYSKKAFYAGKPWVGSVKRRNPKTGELAGYNFFGVNESTKGFKVAVIVDDVCGRGGTFLLLAEAMRKEGVEEVYLVVAHCENNIHNGTVLEGDVINKVYTTDSILSVPHVNLVVGVSYRPEKASKNALIVVDMQNDFVCGTLGSEQAAAIVPNVRAKIQEYSEAGHTIVFTRDTHGENYLETQEGKNLPVKHCILGTTGWEIYGELDSGVDCSYIDKPNFGYADWDLSGYNEIEIIGLCTDVCVVSNALILKAKYPETKISVDASCCAGITHESHKAALLTMEMCQVHIQEET